jgi:FixJ family two-component response regulator
VETHRAHVFEKLQVDSLAQLVRGYAALVGEDRAA